MAIFERGIPTMSFLILAGLIIIFFIVLVSTNNTKIHTIIFLLIIGFYLFVKVCCGPSYSDAKLMQPMAEKISEYIVRHGIPESLKDIADLPYQLDRCEKKQENLEQCTFYKNKKRYKTEIYILGKMDIEIYSQKTQTGLRYELKKNTLNTTQWFIKRSNIIFSSKASGLCSQLRQ
jgi:hypothetical protein